MPSNSIRDTFQYIVAPDHPKQWLWTTSGKLFRNIGSILTFAIPGTFISALVVGIIVYIWTSIGLDSVKLEFVDALAVGATLSATDPVTILSIFNAYKVDPKLYTIIFGESLLNDAISIVMFETCQKFHGQPVKFSSFFEGIGLFLMTFTISTIIGIAIGILVALILKHSHVRRYPQIETCLVLLFAYQSYFSPMEHTCRELYLCYSAVLHWNIMLIITCQDVLKLRQNTFSITSTIVGELYIHLSWIIIIHRSWACFQTIVDYCRIHIHLCC